MLTGTIAFHTESTLIINVNGVGYKVLVPQTVLRSITEPDKPITVFTHTHVREDVLELYGFTDPGDLQLFEKLIGVSGVGCKTALGVFSVGSRNDIIKAIATGDALFFTAVPRLGKKNAQKVIIELKGKLISGDGELGSQPLQDGADEVMEALKTFGFSSSEAATAVRAVQKDGLTTSEQVRLALKYLGK